MRKDRFLRTRARERLGHEYLSRTSSDVWCGDGVPIANTIEIQCCDVYGKSHVHWLHDCT